jgi:single-strand selective monofunctional uracil DNA glycosylase
MPDPRRTPDRARRLVAIARTLRDRTARLEFDAPVTHVYRPLEYAWAPHRRYLERYGGGGARILLLGMNPGPFGMAQTGVPFGDVGMVRDWLRIDGRVERPRAEHPKRPVLGFACPRGEISGQRLWGWARGKYENPARFFDQFLIWNYCPLAFIEASGRNRTPDKLPAGERKSLYAPCDAALRDVVECMRPTHVVGIGHFARERAVEALGRTTAAIGGGPHPSPASPAANRGWVPQFENALRRLGIPREGPQVSDDGEA